MSDLIDRQAAITAICEDGTWLERQGCTEITMCERKQRDADILSELPTIEAVEVVRCNDCVRWNTIFDRTKAEYGLCQIRSQLEATKNDDFCSRGERRADAIS